jgi:hypothetical protein
MQRFVDAGIKFLASPKNESRKSEETMEADNDFSYDDAFTASVAPVDNMPILHLVKCVYPRAFGVIESSFGCCL